MPYTLERAPRQLRIVLHGVVTGSDLSSLGAEVEAAEDELPVLPPRLIDLSGVTHGPPRGFARMFQILNDHPQIEIRIFPAIAEAEAWLAEP